MHLQMECYSFGQHEKVKLGASGIFKVHLRVRIDAYKIKFQTNYDVSITFNDAKSRTRNHVLEVFDIEFTLAP